MKARNLKKGDIIIFTAVVLLAVLLFLFLNVFNQNTGHFVRIEVNGKTETILPLQSDTVYEVKTDDENYNTVIIEDGFAAVFEASCPDKICVKHKKVSKAGESIICLPNKLVVTIVSESDAEIDGVV